MTELLYRSREIKVSEIKLTKQSVISVISENWFDLIDTEYETCKYKMDNFKGCLTDFLNQNEELK
ncbi:MAG: hypothetical protein E6K97_04935 [Thaumarchaeota archaeon]|nr:MAG: hypothetical protein E6K97_04935 [Nitrososphaerota archaeon]